MAGLRPEQIMSRNVWAPDIFKGKVVFCTGGAGTICSAQVGALVLLGANAAILGRRPGPTASAAAHLSSLRPGSIVLPIACDVRSPDSLRAAVDQTLKTLGQIDFVICGAAGNFLSPVTSLSENAFKTVVDIDLLGSYNTVKAVLPHLRATSKLPTSSNSNDGVTKKILFVSATMHYVGIPFQAHCAAAKAAVDALSATLSVELGPFGITSNVIAPGPIEATEGMVRLTPPGMTLEDLIKSVPLGRWGSVKDIADATVWLFSPAGDWVTGGCVVVDGGAWRTSGSGLMGGYPGVMGVDWEEMVKRRRKAAEEGENEEEVKMKAKL